MTAFMKRGMESRLSGVTVTTTRLVHRPAAAAQTTSIKAVLRLVTYLCLIRVTLDSL